MALLYDSFGVRRIQLVVNIWPDLDTFHPGQLSRLYGHLNADDAFDSCDLRANTGARFEGEQWVYDISTSSILLRCGGGGYSTTDELRQRVRGLLAGTRAFFGDQYMIFFVDDVRVFGIVPDDKERNVGEVLSKRLLTRMKLEDRGMPGLFGAGLRLVGDTETFHWHAQIEAPHGAYGVLGLDAQLIFSPEAEPPVPGKDLDMIDEQVMATYDFLNDDVKSFASKLFH